MTGSILPWWGWLFILQTIFIYALFEYARRLSGGRQPKARLYEDEISALVEQRIGSLPLGETTIGDAFKNSDERASTYMVTLSERIEKLDGKVETMAKLALENNKLQNERHELIVKKIEATKTETKAAHDYAIGSVDALQHLLGELRNAHAAADEDHTRFKRIVEQTFENTRQWLNRRCEFIDQGFKAVFDRERLLGLAVKIQNVGDELSGPTNGEPLGDWDTWLAKYGGWNRNVEAWARIAALYRDGVLDRVFDTPNGEYKGQWRATDDLFPDSNAVHDYKTFRIISRNFHVEREPVERCVELAAFAHPSMKGRVDLDADELPSPAPPGRPPLRPAA